MKHVIILAAVLLIAGSAAAQTKDQGRTVHNMRVQPFFFDALNFAGYDEYGLDGRLDVYVHVPYDIITFVKDEEFYTGGYTITLLVSENEGEKLVQDESWERTLEILTFERTTNPAYYDLSQRSLSLPAGKYQLEILFEDTESRKEFRLTRAVEVREFDANLLAISDLMLVRDVETKGGKKQISPQVNPNVAALKDGFQLFYEVYNPYKIPAVTMDYSIIKRGEEVFSKESTQGLKRGRNTFLADIASAGLGIGTYTMKVTVRRSDDSTESGVLARNERGFMIAWLTSGAPISAVDLDEAIDQLRWFAKDEDIEYIRAAETEKEKRRRFEDFWERHNPTPGTDKNPAMIEYYNRVAYANQKFGHFIDGWKTDRGMVYIIYGPPDYIDRHPLDVESKPYEIWEYYDVNRRFIFVDESGFGDYRLLYPIWDDRNRLR